VASQPDLAPHVKATVALNEGGGGSVRSPNGLAYGFATGEKGRLEVRVHVSGKPGHASAPWRAENALERAGIVLERVRRYAPELDTSHPLFAALPERYGLKGPLTPKSVPDVIEKLDPDYPSVAGTLRAASRLTLVPTMLTAGIKSNSIPAGCTVVCDSRTLPHQDAAFVTGEVEDLLADLPWARVEVETTAVSNASEYEHPFRDAALAGLRLALRRPEVELVPALCGGFTDSRFLRPLGTQVYDFMPLHPEAEERDTGVHGTNERIEVAGLVARTRFLVAAACLYLGIE
jgi:acetylornithine deacetylase/succinyl-diaminopimelate desuccinylase-like protein